MADPPRNIRRLLPWAIAAVVVLAIIGLLLTPVIFTARRAALRAIHVNNFKIVGLALHNFMFVYDDRLPPAVHTDEEGRRLCSWRARLMPYLEAMMFHVDYSERWDDPANQWLSTTPLRVFCWSPEKHYPQCMDTNVLAITGPGTAFEESRMCRLQDLDPDTILAIDCADSGIHWMEPGDLSVDQVPESIVRGTDGHGALVLFADGAVWSIDPDMPLDDLKKFFTIAGAKRYDRVQVLMSVRAH